MVMRVVISDIERSDWFMEIDVNETFVYEFQKMNMQFLISTKHLRTQSILMTSFTTRKMLESNILDVDN